MCLRKILQAIVNGCRTFQSWTFSTLDFFNSKLFQSQIILSHHWKTPKIVKVYFFYSKTSELKSPELKCQATCEITSPCWLVHTFISKLTQCLSVLLYIPGTRVEKSTLFFLKSVTLTFLTAWCTDQNSDDVLTATFLAFLPREGARVSLKVLKING